jgi:hypothetical protein
MKDIECKNIPFEVKVIDEEGSFEAYGSTRDEDLGNDVMMEGCFAKVLQEKNIDDILLLLQHDTGEIIGEFKSIEEDHKGLLVKGQLFINDIAKAAETRFLMLKNKLKAMSIGFRIPPNGSFREDGKRMIKEADLIEISVVTFPMNPGAEILRVKNMKDLDIREFEQKLRDVGLSQKEAKAVCANGFKGLHRDDADEEKKEEKADEWSEVLKQLKGK